MIRWTLPAALLMLAACSGGKDEPPPAETADTADEAAPAAPAPAAPVTGDADLVYTPDPSLAPPTAPDPGVGSGDRAIPAAIQGRWALKAADCAARPGTDLTALVVDAGTLRFYESAGDLVRVRDRSANRIVADFRFSGEGETWNRLMLLGLADSGKTLVRRDYGEGAAAQPMRYTRCAA